MNNKIRTTILGGLVLASLAAPAVAGDFSTNSITTTTVAPPVISGGGNFSFSTGYHSTYLFRGIDFGDDLIDASIEASFSLGGLDLTAGVWGASLFDSDANASNGLPELDFYVSTSKDLGFVTAELGYILYYFNDFESANTQEVYLGLSKEVAGVGLSATWYYDFDQADNSYLELGVEKTFVGIDAALTVGTNPTEGEFTHAQLTLSKTFSLNSEVALTPYVSYSQALANTDELGATRDDQFLAGVSVGFDF